ncbi:MAG: hypothetical protein HY552_02435 [Elusimicrobia bacterium]|nr:hypothetical protein [Elusimicrobiota bacterium]
MSAAFAALFVVLAAPGRAALDSRLAAAPEPEPGVFRGLALSLGPGRPTCGRATFDRVQAAGGGLVFVVDAAGPGDEEAVRLSQAVVARRGGLSGFAAAAARRHGVPAVALGRGVWDPAGPSLSLSESVPGKAFLVEGVAVRVASGERERVLREGGAVCVDPAAGTVSLPPAEQAEAAVAAAQAALAYDGLRDAGALERWLEAEPGAAAALAAELAPRALEGGVAPADLARLMRAARASAGPRQAGVDAAARRAWARAARRAAAALASCPADAAAAPTAAALERVSAAARGIAARAAAAGRALGAGDEGVAAAARACLTAARRRRRSVPASVLTLEEAAAAAGADRVLAAELPDGAWSDFVAQNGLSSHFARLLPDASLDLRRKSERLRARILEGRLPPDSPAGRAALAAAAGGSCLVIGEDVTLQAPAGEVLRAVVEVWAASWEPGPLGARLRAGRGADIAGRVRVERLRPAEVSGLAFSRDPGSGLRGRVVVEAAPGGVDGLLSGSAPADRWALDARDGRAREAVVAGARPALSPERLARVARLARGLDAWSGGGVELAFSFDGPRLRVHHVRPLEPPRLPAPAADPFSPRPEAEALSVRPVRP